MLWTPDIIASIDLLATREGGRAGPTPAHSFGCPLEYENEYFDCRLDLSDVGPLVPGTEARVPVKFLVPEHVLPRLYVGAQFTLWEGRTIGRGRVVELCNDVHAR
jgi:hypothetical protein